MKLLMAITRIAAIALAAVVFVLFFFDFVKIVTIAGESIKLTGFQLALGSKQTIAKQTVMTFKGLWYLISFLLTTTGLVLAALIFKFKKTAIAAMIFELLAMISLLVLYFTRPLGKYVDYRHIKVKLITTESTFLIAVIAVVLAFLALVAFVVIRDYVEVSETKGAKTIPQRIVRFLKDYKGEIKKIVWPTKDTVVKNTTVVVIMCVLLGVYIAAIDYGLSNLLKLLYSGLK